MLKLHKWQQLIMDTPVDVIDFNKEGKPISRKVHIVAKSAAELVEKIKEAK